MPPAQNRIFVGERTIDGSVVTVDDVPLDPQLALKQFTDRGFEWGYEGNGPRQLALAILVEHIGDNSRALSLCEDFMLRVVANFGNEWEMSGSDIDIALNNIEADA